ncbi:MAG: DUF4139 domain-containing protein [Flavobacteriales bacterium]|nr:DUF4139 domain-containing protein [Flavobacteriales bacterium]
MNKIVILAFLLGSIFQAQAGEKEIVKATLNEVTVYSQGAQLHHRANYTVKTGVTEIIVEGISSYIDAKSIQVKAVGNVVILDSRYSLYYPQPGPVSEDGIPLKIKKDIALLEDSLRNMAYDIQEIQDEIDVLNVTKSIVMNNGSMKSQGRVNDSLNFLKQAVEFYTLKVTEINKKVLALNKRKNEKINKREGMEERLENLRNYQNGNGLNLKNNNPIPRVIITVSSTEPVSGKMNLSYFVSNAGWTPFYDLRSEALTGKINLTYKAQVYQNTGLDWNDVKLNISTNNPYANKTKPELQPWYIDYSTYRVEATKKRNLDYNNAPAVQSEAFNMGYTFNKDAFEDIPALTANQFTTVVQQLIAAEFKIDLPYTIKSNNEQHMVLIKQTDLDTKFKYYSVPKMDKGVYLVAQMTKLDELQLVPARANIYFDGSYIGETYIDPTSMDDTLNLSLGKDPNIMVKRTLLKKDSKDKVIAEKRERSFAYSIEVKNMKSIPVEIVIQDQIPITQNADITIEKSDLGKGGNLDETTGLMEWSFTLKPKESKLFDYNFKVKHNKDKQVNL